MGMCGAENVPNAPQSGERSAGVLASHEFSRSRRHHGRFRRGWIAAGAAVLLLACLAGRRR